MPVCRLSPAPELRCLPGGRGLYPGTVPTHGRGGGQPAPLVRLSLAPSQRQPEARVRLRVGPGHHGHPQDVRLQ